MGAFGTVLGGVGGIFGGAAGALGGALLGGAEGLFTDESGTTIPGASAQENALNKLMMDAFFPQMMKEAGFELVKRGGANVAVFNTKLTDLNTQLQNLGGQPDKIEEALDLRKQIVAIEKEIEAAQVYDIRELADERTEGIRSKYGADSPEYQEALTEWQDSKYAAEELQEDMQKQYAENTLKLLRGDFAINDEQKAFVEKNFAGQREAMESMFSELEGMSSDEWYSEMGDYSDMANKSGMSLGDFAEAAGPGMAQGKGVKGAFQQVMEVNRQLLKMGVEDVTNEVTKRTMEQAVALGRDPMDPAFQQQMASETQREVTRGQLQLAGMEATEAQRQSEKMGDRRFQLAQQKGSMRLGMEQQESALRMQMGGFGQQAGAGQATMAQSGYQQALGQQNLANLQGAMGVPSGQAATLAQGRFGQPTTKSTQSPWSVAMDIGTIGAGFAKAGAGGGG